MKSLALALYTEGSSDHLFLPILIRRTSRRLLEQYKQVAVRTLPVKSIVFDKVGLGQAECIVQAACKATDYDVLIIHADADHPTPEKAFHERFWPGYQQVQQTLELVCKNLLPIIPAQMTEAWMLADYETLLQRVIGTNMNAQSLGLPTRVRRVEADANPKHTLKEAVRKAYEYRPQRRRRIDITTLYEPLAERISLERLNSVPSYQQFVTDLTETLIALNLIPKVQ